MKGKSAFMLALATSLVFLAGKFLVFDNIIQHKSRPPSANVVFSAYREGSLGGIKLNLYQDQHFEFTWAGTRNVATGRYAFRSDTLVLTAAIGTRIVKKARQMQFVVADGVLLESPNITGIKFLGIGIDRLHKAQ